MAKPEHTVSKTRSVDSDFCLEKVCEDSISALKFHPLRSSKLLCSSWDGTVSLYDIKRSSPGDMLLCRVEHGAPVLDAAFLWNSAASNILFTAGHHSHLIMHDIHTGSKSNVGYHKSGIQFVEYNPYTDCIMTAGFDHSIKCWDARSGPDKPVNWVSHPGLIYAACQRGPFLTVAFRSRNRLMVWDVRKAKWHLPYQRRSLCVRQDPLLCLALSGACDKFAYGTQYGRVAVEYMAASKEEQRKKYVFKCHRQAAAGAGAVERVYPVNAICFYKDSAIFATGGSDGYVNIWDSVNHKRVCQYRQYTGAEVDSLSFSSRGQYLAIGTSPAIGRVSECAAASGRGGQHNVYIKRNTFNSSAQQKVGTDTAPAHT